MNGTCCCVELTVTEDAEVLLSVAEDSQVGLDVEEQFVTGGGITPSGTKTISVTQNGTTNTDVTYYANAKVVANVPNSYAASDEGKVVQDGDLESQTTATFETNDTYDTTTIKQVTVDVPASAVDSGYVYINENDTVDVVGYAQAVVNVPASAVDSGTKSISVTANGTTTHDVVGYASASITANVPNTYAAGDEGKVVDNGALVSQGSATYTINSTYDTTKIKSVTVNVSGGGSPTLQTKSVSYTPTESQQTAEITADEGYDALQEVDVTVGAISSTYVGSGITRRDDTDLSASGATVSVPSGYYEDSETYTVSSGSATTPATTVTANPSISVNSSTGVITATASATKSVTPTVSAGYVSSGTAGTITVSGSNTSALSTQSGTTITPTTSEQTAVAAGKYTLGAVKVAAMPSGTAGTPVATKGAVSNHSIDVTPSVTNSAGYVASETKTGTAVTVTASELVSGSETKTQNGTYNVTNLAQLVVDVSSGGTTEPEPLDVDLVDYDGTLLYTYSKADFLALESLPANPSHTGLVAQGWNWTLADAKTYVTAHGTLVIGQSYRTDDGKSRFYISIPDGAYPDFAITLFVATGYNATIAWGDGNSDTIAGKATYTHKDHVYSTTGDYVITIDCQGALQFGCTGTNVSAFYNGQQYNYRGTYLKKVELSNNVTKIYRNAFSNATALESISIPTSMTNIREDSNGNFFANCFSLKGLVIPSTCEFMGSSTVTYSAVKYISLPKMTFAIGSNISTFVSYCPYLRKLTFPDGVSSSYNLNILSTCPGLVRLVVMGSITTLDQNYCRGAALLPRVDIPSSVTSIAANAFNGSRGIREFHVYATSPPTLSNANAFGNLNGRGFTIYVPYSADHSVLNAYKTASNWSTYASNIQEESA